MTLGVFQHESAAGGDGDGEDGEHEGGGATFAGEFHLVVAWADINIRFIK